MFSPVCVNKVTALKDSRIGAQQFNGLRQVWKNTFIFRRFPSGDSGLTGTKKSPARCGFCGGQGTPAPRPPLSDLSSAHRYGGGCSRRTAVGYNPEFRPVCRLPQRANTATVENCLFVSRPGFWTNTAEVSTLVQINRHPHSESRNHLPNARSQNNRSNIKNGS